MPMDLHEDVSEAKRDIFYKESQISFAFIDNLIDAFLAKEISALYFKKQAKAFLAKRFAYMGQSSISYCFHPLLPINQVCLGLATLSAYSNESIAKILMPSINTVIGEVHAHECRDSAVAQLHAYLMANTEVDESFNPSLFMLSEDGKSLIDIMAVIEYASSNPSRMFAHPLKPKEKIFNLSAPSLDRLVLSDEAVAQNMAYIQAQYDKSINPGSFFYTLVLLQRGLHESSVLRKGSDNLAEIPELWPYLMKAFKEYRRLSPTQLKVLDEVTIETLYPAEGGGKQRSLRQLLLYIFSFAPKHYIELTTAEKVEAEKNRLFECADTLSNYLHDALITDKATKLLDLFADGTIVEPVASEPPAALSLDALSQRRAMPPMTAPITSISPYQRAIETLLGSTSHVTNLVNIFNQKVMPKRVPNIQLIFDRGIFTHALKLLTPTGRLHLLKYLRFNYLESILFLPAHLNRSNLQDNELYQALDNAIPGFKAWFQFESGMLSTGVQQSLLADISALQNFLTLLTEVQFSQVIDNFKAIEFKTHNAFFTFIQTLDTQKKKSDFIAKLKEAELLKHIVDYQSLSQVFALCDDTKKSLILKKCLLPQPTLLKNIKQYTVIYRALPLSEKLLFLVNLPLDKSQLSQIQNEATVKLYLKYHIILRNKSLNTKAKITECLKTYVYDGPVWRFLHGHPGRPTPYITIVETMLKRIQQEADLTPQKIVQELCQQWTKVSQQHSLRHIKKDDFYHRMNVIAAITGENLIDVYHEARQTVSLSAGESGNQEAYIQLTPLYTSPST